MEKLKDIISDLEVMKDKLEDLQTTQSYFTDKHFSKRKLKTREQLFIHGWAYSEQRIATEQFNELLNLYVTEFETIIKQLEAQTKKALNYNADQSK